MRSLDLKKLNCKSVIDVKKEFLRHEKRTSSFQIQHSNLNKYLPENSVMCRDRTSSLFWWIILWIFGYVDASSKLRIIREKSPILNVPIGETVVKIKSQVVEFIFLFLVLKIGWNSWIVYSSLCIEVYIYIYIILRNHCHFFLPVSTFLYVHLALQEDVQI